MEVLEAAALPAQAREDALLAAARLEKSDWRAAARTLVRGDAEATGVARVGFWRFHESGRELVCEIAWLGPETRYVSGERIHASDFPAYFSALTEQRVLAATDARHDPRMQELAASYLEPHGITSMMDVPVWSHGRVVGILCHEHVGPPRLWTTGEQQFAVAMAEMLSLSLEATARREAEEARRKALEERASERELLRAVLCQMPASVIIIDADGKVVLANDRVRDVAGARLQPGESLLEFLRRKPIYRPDGSPVRYEDTSIIRTLQSGETVLGSESRVPGPGGDIRSFLTSTAPVHGEDGRVVAAVAVAMDVTHRRVIEEQLESEARLRETFLGILGHDLRNPLAATMVHAQLAGAQAHDPASVRDHAAAILESTRRMSRLVADLLAFIRSRATPEALPLRCAPMDLAEVAATSLADVRASYPHAVLRLTTEGDTRGVWDRDRLVQVVTNLLTNAIAHGPPGHPVDVRLADRDRDVLLTVHDDGPGIPEEVRRHMFEPYRTAARDVAAPAMPAGGRAHVGLGLFIVNAVVRSHGGTIEVASGPGHGTTFSIRLPREPGENAGGPADHAHEGEPREKTGIFRKPD